MSALEPGPHSTSAGWYAAGDGPYERWWDGRAWSEATRPLAPSAGFPMMTQPGYAVPYAFAATDQRDKPVETALAWVVTAIMLGYMLPWAIAATRGKSNSLVIGLLNFLIGWTFVGWAIALVMACGAHRNAVLSPYRY